MTSIAGDRGCRAGCIVRELLLPARVKVVLWIHQFAVPCFPWTVCRSGMSWESASSGSPKKPLSGSLHAPFRPVHGATPTIPRWRWGWWNASAAFYIWEGEYSTPNRSVFDTSRRACSSRRTCRPPWRGWETATRPAPSWGASWPSRPGACRASGWPGARVCHLRTQQVFGPYPPRRRVICSSTAPLQMARREAPGLFRLAGIDQRPIEPTANVRRC